MEPWCEVQRRCRKAYGQGSYGQDRHKGSGRHGGHGKPRSGQDRVQGDWGDYQVRQRYRHRGVSPENCARSASEYYGRSHSSSREHRLSPHRFEGKRDRNTSYSNLDARFNHEQQRNVSPYQGNQLVLERTDEFYEREFPRLQRTQLQNDAQQDNTAGSGLKRFVTFYFTNIPALILYYYLRQGFKVCGILEDLFVAKNFNEQGKAYGFARYGKVKNVEKLTKALNDITFGPFEYLLNLLVLIAKRSCRMGVGRKRREWEMEKKF